MTISYFLIFFIGSFVFMMIDVAVSYFLYEKFGIKNLREDILIESLNYLGEDKISTYLVKLWTLILKAQPLLTPIIVIYVCFFQKNYVDCYLLFLIPISYHGYKRMLQADKNSFYYNAILTIPISAIYCIFVYFLKIPDNKNIYIIINIAILAVSIFISLLKEANFINDSKKEIEKIRCGKHKKYNNTLQNEIIREKQELFEFVDFYEKIRVIQTMGVDKFDIYLFQGIKYTDYVFEVYIASYIILKNLIENIYTYKFSKDLQEKILVPFYGEIFLFITNENSEITLNEFTDMLEEKYNSVYAKHKDKSENEKKFILSLHIACYASKKEKAKRELIDYILENVVNVQYYKYECLISKFKQNEDNGFCEDMDDSNEPF